VTTEDNRTKVGMYSELPSLWQPLSDEDKNALFNNASDTIICSHNKDGTIHATPIWFRYKEGKFYILTFKFARKARNLIRDNTVTLSIVHKGEGETQTKAAIIYGSAEVEINPETGKDSTAYWVWDKYMTTADDREQLEEALEKHSRDEALALITIKPKKIVHYYP
jgi:nitroimidazol reductase NimA-like FMN-containing flavoprotein (pyridoxamine 5'-phosphate oxidase superfamily)